MSTEWKRTALLTEDHAHLPKVWYAIRYQPENTIIAAFASSDDASDWLFGDGSRKKPNPKAKDCVIVKTLSNILG